MKKSSGRMVDVKPTRPRRHRKQSDLFLYKEIAAGAANIRTDGPDALPHGMRMH